MGIRLDVSNLTVRRGGCTLLDDIEFSVQPGEFVAILGPNGAGKTTLLRAIAGERPYNGRIRVDGDNLYDNPEKWLKRIGQVPADNVLHESLPVSKALEYAGRLRGLDLHALKGHIIRDLLRQFGIEDKYHSVISQLSSGERKKVNICAELLTEPGLLLLDEPTTNLDPHAEGELMSMLAKRAEEGTTVIVVSHTIRSLGQCDCIIFVGNSKIEGFVVQESDEWKWIDPDARQVQETVSAEEFSSWLVGKFQEHHTKWRPPGPPSGKRLSGRHTASKDARLTWQHYQIILSRQMALLYYEGWRIPVREIWERVRAFLFRRKRSHGAEKNHKRNILDWNWMVPWPLCVAPALGFLTGFLLLAVLPNEALVQSENRPVGLDAGDASTAAFLIGLVAFLLGLMGSFREVVREISIYQHERLKGLEAKPYLLAKFTLLGILYGVVAPVFMFFVLGTLQDVPSEGLVFAGDSDALLSLVLTSMAGVAIGLSISCVGSSGEWATVLMAVSVIANALLAGLVKNKDLERLIDTVSVLVPSRWAMEGLKTTTELYCWGVQRILRDHYSPAHLVAIWLALVACVFIMLIVAYLALHRRDKWLTFWERMELLVSRGNYIYVVAGMIAVISSIGLYGWSAQAHNAELFCEHLDELSGIEWASGQVSAARCAQEPTPRGFGEEQGNLTPTPFPGDLIPPTSEPTSAAAGNQIPSPVVTPTTAYALTAEPTGTVEQSPTPPIPSEPTVVLPSAVDLYLGPTTQYKGAAHLAPDSILTLLSKANRSGTPWLRVRAVEETGRECVGWVCAAEPPLSEHEWKVNVEPKAPPDCARPLVSTCTGMAEFDLTMGRLGTWVSDGSGEIGVVIDLYRNEVGELSERLTLHLQVNGRDVRAIPVESQRKRFLLQNGVFNVQISREDRLTLLLTPSSSNTLRTLDGHVSVFFIPPDCEFSER